MWGKYKSRELSDNGNARKMKIYVEKSFEKLKCVYGKQDVVEHLKNPIIETSFEK